MREGLELAIAVSHMLDKTLNSEHLILHLSHVTGKKKKRRTVLVAIMQLAIAMNHLPTLEHG